MPAIPVRLRLAVTALLVVLFLHFTAVQLSPESSYAQKTSIWRYSGSGGTMGDERKAVEHLYDGGLSAGLTNSSTTNAGANGAAKQRKANAAFVILARNSDLWSIMESIQFMEDRFNRKYNYPYVFLNDVPFDDNFKQKTQGIISGKAEYGLIPKEHWSKHPDWIDEDRATKARQAMTEAKVIYGDSVPYREMCRYQSGFFFRHPLLDKYEWYWRIEPSVKYFCDLDYDPFLFMQDNNMKYGFAISIYEYIETIPTLWDTVKNFTKTYPQHIPAQNAMSWLSDDGGETYNRCHFWSNFEIGSLSLWRSQAYTDFFEYLDRAGGFFCERWGDAPVHSIAAALFLPFEQIHYFYDIGYRHEPFQHCPKGDVHKDRCYCNDAETFNEHWYSCTPKFLTEKGTRRPSVFDEGRAG